MKIKVRYSSFMGTFSLRGKNKYIILVIRTKCDLINSVNVIQFFLK